MVSSVLAFVDGLMKTYSALEQHADAKRELPKLLAESKKRVKRIRTSVDRYSKGVPENFIRGDVLKKARRTKSVFKNRLRMDAEFLQYRHPAHAGS